MVLERKVESSDSDDGGSDDGRSDADHEDDNKNRSSTKKGEKHLPSTKVKPYQTIALLSILIHHYYCTTLE